MKSILAMSINSFSAGILCQFWAHRDLPSQMHMEYLWNIKISNLIKAWSLIFMQLMWLTEAFNAEVLNARNYLNRNISVV